MKEAFIRETKDYTVHVRFSGTTYGKVIDEAVRLGQSQTDTVRYIVTRYFETQAEKKDQGGGA